MTTFDQITTKLGEQAIELPSWAFGNSGTRFRVFGMPGTPRDRFEKIADAAQVNKDTALSRRSPGTSRGTRSTTTPHCAGRRRTPA